MLAQEEAPRINPWGSPSTTLAETLPTVSFNANTSGISPDATTFIWGGALLLNVLAARSHPLPLEHSPSCPRLPLCSVGRTDATEALLPPPTPVSAYTPAGMRQLVRVAYRTTALFHACFDPRDSATGAMKKVPSSVDCVSLLQCSLRSQGAQRTRMRHGRKPHGKQPKRASPEAGRKITRDLSHCLRRGFTRIEASCGRGDSLGKEKR